jgi:ribulose bisphosphate carboxylase small subunit
MEPAQRCTALSTLPCINEVEQLVRKHLRDNWIVRIEHADEVSPRYTTWQQWGSPLFAIKDSSPVLDRILACRANHPTHAIRLHAEKVHPGIRFVYSVHRPQDNPPGTTVSQQVRVPARAGANSLHSLGSRVQAARNALWRYAALVGMMVASVIMVEQAIS